MIVTSLSDLIVTSYRMSCKQYATLRMLQPRVLGFLNRVVPLVSVSNYYLVVGSGQSILTTSQVVQSRKAKHLWQSRVEIEGYSVAYFDRIAVFEVPYC